ncbi:alkanesulfonate monooxygenase SsuD/methylene tetrahydromethanopterin reductase-like flavin-dependent oxidoreductase (luciferase family) [Streptomyces sp. SLBN-115]|nr:alkanesulfonate monooxygenase SsuD/methylene tetrahydromethanopterin reductase-like flavin-dependent oxidoreductase (luciferase family) [Streptomyces sp. SLBN-115]
MHDDTVRCGVHSGQQYQTFDDVLDLWHRAENAGYDWVSVFDHMRPHLFAPDGPCFEGPTLLAALAARTTRVRCAILVSAVSWRHPALLANIASTVDHISGGRVELGLGAGSQDLAHDQYGLPFPGAAERLRRLDETCHVIRRLWEQPIADYRGAHYRLVAARLRPRPVQRRLPLTIGGSGKRHMLRIVAEHADTWNSAFVPPEHYARKRETLARHARELGRNPASIRGSLTFRAVLGEDHGDVAERRSRIAATVPDDLPEYAVFGTPEECVERLVPYLRLGVRDFLLGLRPPVDHRTLHLFSERVAPVLRASL